MKILAFAGSNSKNSINKKLVSYAAARFEKDEVEIVDINDISAPIYGIDHEKEFGIPSDVLQFAEKISASDLILLSLAEHNGAYAAAFKSLYDWISRIPERKIFDHKPLVLMSTSPGGRGGASVLELASARFPRDSAELMGVFSLPSFNDSFEDGRIVNEEKNMELIKLLDKVRSSLVG